MPDHYRQPPCIIKMLHCHEIVSQSFLNTKAPENMWIGSLSCSSPHFASSKKCLGTVAGAIFTENGTKVIELFVKIEASEFSM